MSEQFSSQVETSSAADAGLSPASVALIERFLRQRPKPKGLAGAHEISAIVVYLMGEASPGDAAAIELHLARDSDARSLYRRVDKAIESLRRLAWDDVARAAARENNNGEDIDAEVARIWQQRLIRQMKIKPVSLTRYLDDFGGWSAAWGDAAMRDSDQGLAWSTMRFQSSIRC